VATTKYGKSLIVELSVNQVTDPDGVVLHILALHDITGMHKGIKLGDDSDHHAWYVC